MQVDCCLGLLLFPPFLVYIDTILDQKGLSFSLFFSFLHSRLLSPLHSIPSGTKFSSFSPYYPEPRVAVSNNHNCNSATRRLSEGITLPHPGQLCVHCCDRHQGPTALSLVGTFVRQQREGDRQFSPIYLPGYPALHSLCRVLTRFRGVAKPVLYLV